MGKNCTVSAKPIKMLLLEVHNLYNNKTKIKFNTALHTAIHSFTTL